MLLKINLKIHLIVIYSILISTFLLLSGCMLDMDHDTKWQKKLNLQERRTIQYNAFVENGGLAKRKKELSVRDVKIQDRINREISMSRDYLNNTNNTKNSLNNSKQQNNNIPDLQSINTNTKNNNGSNKNTTNKNTKNNAQNAKTNSDEVVKSKPIFQPKIYNNGQDINDNDQIPHGAITTVSTNQNQYNSINANNGNNGGNNDNEHTVQLNKYIDANDIPN